MDITLNQYKEHKPSVLNAIQRITTDDPDFYSDEFKAFVRLSFDLFSDAPDERFVFTDGANDQGIDFYTEVDDCYEIFQCKFAQLDTLLNSNNPITFDKSCVMELENAYKYLTEKHVSDTAKKEIKQLRGNLIAQSPDSISFNLCVFGALSEDANQKFKELELVRNSKDQNISFNLYEWQPIIQNLVMHTQPTKSHNYKFNIPPGQILTADDYCYFLGYARDFRELFADQGWSLFDLNVRSELIHSKVNKKIKQSISHEKTRRRFHHLNNGIVMVCDSYDKHSDDSVKLNNFQIINGCQTVLSIYRAYNEIAQDKDKCSDFDKKCFVQVKAIKRNKDVKDLLDQIIISTNNQNAMRPRNLKSNSQEQKNILAKFYNLPNRWFYQRKDGEFESIKSIDFPAYHIRKEDFRSGKTFRYLDNEDLAKTWSCFCGFSYEVMMVSDFFKDEDLYDRIFNSCPTSKLWDEFIDPEIDFSFKKEYFEFGQPTAEEYLLPYLIWGFIKEYSVKPIENRKLALERGVKAGKLTKTDSQEKQASYLVTDIDYMVNNIINNLKEELLEMYSFLLCKKYGHGYNAARNILQSEAFSQLVETPDYKFFVENMEKCPSNMLYSIYEFLRSVLEQLYGKIVGEYTASSRRKSYLATSTFIQKFKKMIVELDEMQYFKIQIKPWKIPNESFLDSLPKLS